MVSTLDGRHRINSATATGFSTLLLRANSGFISSTLAVFNQELDAMSNKPPGTDHPPIFDKMGINVINVDPETQSCSLGFDVGLEFCHSVNVIQGGFVTAMIDAAMAHALILNNENITGMPSLEIKVSFLRASLAGQVTAVGRIVRKGRNILFLEGELLDPSGRVTATATSTATYTTGGG